MKIDFLYFLKKISKRIQSNKDSLFKVNIDRQKKYISKFKEPKDDIERSYFQYKCQNYLNGRMLTFILNSIFFILFLVYWVKLSKINIINKKKVDAVFFSNDISHNIIPEKILEEFSNIEYVKNEDILHLNKEDKLFLKNLISRYPFSWLFIYKCMLKIAMYSAQIEKNDPKSIIVYAEYSFTSSILTKYCESKKVEHINIMHGEKLFYIRDSFFRFHRFYIWDKYYEHLFNKLRASKNQFIIEIPQSLKFKLNSLSNSNKVYDYTYYLGGERKEEMILIANTLNKLLSKGYKIAIRPHPRYTDYKIMQSIFDGFCIEDTSLTIEESILRTRHAVSLYSTVLNQAYYNDVNVVIDDISNRHKFSMLRILEYIMLNDCNKSYLLLSDIIKSENYDYRRRV